MEQNHLTHHGVLGMKWGVRKSRGRYIGAKRQVAGAKKDLKTLDNGGHLSVGLTKKRQAALDARDRKAAEKRLSDAEKRLQKKDKTKDWSDDAKEAAKIKQKKMSQRTNSELRKVNERSRLEQEYSRLNPSKIKKGAAAVATMAAVTTTAITLYNNSSKLVRIGQKIAAKNTKG